MYVDTTRMMCVKEHQKAQKALHIYACVKYYQASYRSNRCNIYKKNKKKREPSSKHGIINIVQHTAPSIESAYVSIRQHASAYVNIRQHTSAYGTIDSQNIRSELCVVCVNGLRVHTLVKGSPTLSLVSEFSTPSLLHRALIDRASSPLSLSHT
jgi:hypothetical protein